MKNLIAKIRNPKVLRTLLVIIISAIIIGGTYYLLKKENRVEIENSLVQAPVISFAPLIPGKLTELDVHEGDSVNKGDTLAVVGTDSLKAYTNGLVIKVNNTPGGTVGPQTTIVQMIDPATMRIVGTIDENKGLDEVKAGQIASFTVDALPGKTFWGYVDEIAPSAKQTQLSFSISSERPTQQFEIYVKFDPKKYPEIKNGMSAKMTVYTK
jgi:multidrug resistance efflux pump